VSIYVIPLSVRVVQTSVSLRSRRGWP